MGTLIAKAFARRWLAFGAVLFCVLAPVVSGNRFCTAASADAWQHTASVCDGMTNPGCCTGCCQREEQKTPSKSSSPRHASSPGVADARSQARFCACFLASWPVPRTTSAPATDGVAPHHPNGFRTGNAPAIHPCGGLLALSSFSSSDLVRIVLRRCHPGNAPPDS